AVVTDGVPRIAGVPVLDPDARATTVIDVDTPRSIAGDGAGEDRGVAAFHGDPIAVCAVLYGHAADHAAEAYADLTATGTPNEDVRPSVGRDAAADDIERRSLRDYDTVGGIRGHGYRLHGGARHVLTHPQVRVPHGVETVVAVAADGAVRDDERCVL